MYRPLLISLVLMTGAPVALELMHDDRDCRPVGNGQPVIPDNHCNSSSGGGSHGYSSGSSHSGGGSSVRQSGLSMRGGFGGFGGFHFGGSD